ncbi:MAG: helix-turn-helix transcriptional regulator [Ktedonobacteraceae bacterium]
MIRLRVKEVAGAKGISQSKLSRLSDINITTIQLMYRKPADTNITLHTLNRLCHALGVSPADLLEYSRD